jgi:predicted secreted protein
MPTTISKAWQVSCDSLNVADTAAMLTAIKSMQPMTLLWDETATSNNQTLQNATFARKGSAYLNDVTFNFNDRENATKSLQFTGSGALESLVSGDAVEVISIGSYTKGQFVRLLIGNDNTTTPTKFIAGAKQLSLHVSLTMEDATTKDTTGEWQVQEPTAINYDISTTALVRSNDTITSAVQGQELANLETIYEGSTPVKWKIANVSGDNQRTASSTIVSGSAVLTQLTQNAPNRQSADYTAQFNGYGEYSVAA